MRILITGATGFVGKTLIPTLVEEGWEEIALIVRNFEKAQTLFSSFPKLVFIDTASDWPKKVKSFNPDVVIHLATYFTSKSDFKNATEIINTNVLFTAQILEVITHTCCRCFINIGTFSEYQHGDGKFKSNNLYSASKTSVRPIIQFYQGVGGFKWINVIIYSPYGRFNSQKKVVDYLVEAVGSSNPVAFSDGEQILDFIHVDDIASFFVNLLSKFDSLPDKFYEFHLGTGKGYSIREMAQVIGEVFGEKVNADWGKLSRRDNEITHVVAPISNNLALLNWKSKLSVEEGIQILKNEMLNNTKKGGGN